MRSVRPDYTFVDMIVPSEVGSIEGVQMTDQERKKSFIAPQLLSEALVSLWISWSRKKEESITVT
eukprot:1486898-Amphidinium_carterae.1